MCRRRVKKKDDTVFQTESKFWNIGLLSLVNFFFTIFFVVKIKVVNLRYEISARCNSGREYNLI